MSASALVQQPSVISMDNQPWQDRAFAPVSRNTPTTIPRVSGIFPNCDQPAHVFIDPPFSPPSLEDIHVVWDFFDVFPDELPGSLVNWELNKFTIKNKYSLPRVNDLFYRF